MESRSRLANIIIGRFVFVLMAVAFAAMAVVELMVALHLDATQTLVRGAMRGGAVLWLTVLATGWSFKLRKEKESSLLCLVFLTIISTGSVAGIYFPIFTTFALWANAMLSVFFIVVIAWSFPQTWRNCAVAVEQTQA